MEAGKLEANLKAKQKMLAGYQILDDHFMRKVFEDKACTETLLRTILKREDLEVDENLTQAYLKNLQGKSSCLDVMVRDKDGKIYDIEIQRKHEPFMERRSRYYGSVLDCNAFKEGEEYKNLPERYVIFILDNDYFNDGYQVYHINAHIEETGKPFNDGAHIIFIDASNGQDKKISNPELEDLMTDFRCPDPNKIKNEIFARRVRELKETKKGKVVMNEVIQEVLNKNRAEGKAEGLVEGEVKGKAEMILKFMDVLGIGQQEAMDKSEIPASDWPMYAKVIDELKAKRKAQLVH